MAVIDTAPACAARRAPAMGTLAHVIVVGAPTAVFGAARDACQRIEDLEQRWTRFRADSELCHLNASAGRACRVHEDTVRLVTELVRAWRLSEGSFDPALGPALAEHGYDRTFADVDARVAVRRQSLPVPATDLGDVAVDHSAGTVRLPAGLELDAGGLGKGLAADLVVAELMVRPGVEGALVSVGGDLRFDGRGPHGPGWAVEVGEPVAGVPDEVLVLSRGGIATSTPLRRRWRTDAGWAHHLLDASTAAPAIDPPRAVTVIADRATDAEWIATAIATGARELLYRLGGDFCAVLTEADGRRIEHGPIEEYRT